MLKSSLKEKIVESDASFTQNDVVMMSLLIRI